MCLFQIAAIAMQGAHAGAPLQYNSNYPTAQMSLISSEMGIISVICLIRVIRV